MNSEEPNPNRRENQSGARPGNRGGTLYRQDAGELPVIEAAHELAEWTLMRVHKFPVHYRQALGKRLEDRALDLVDLLLRAKYRANKAELLREANMALESYRFLARLACKLEGCFTPPMFQKATRRVYLVGTQVGGWLRSVEGRASVSGSEQGRRPGIER